MYILFIILLSSSSDSYGIQRHSDHNRMDQCFEARDLYVEKTGRPIVNYQAICVLRKHEKIAK